MTKAINEKQDELQTLNMQKALKRMAGKKHLLLKALNMFIGTSAQKIQSLKQIIDEKNQEKGRNEVHALKGTAVTLGAEKIGNLAKTIELAIKDNDFVRASQLFQNLESEFVVLKNVIKNEEA